MTEKMVLKMCMLNCYTNKKCNLETLPWNTCSVRTILTNK